MVIRVMTLLTLLMLLACLMIGASIALAWPVGAAETADVHPAVLQDVATPSNHLALPQQADPDSAQRPYQETLAEADPVDQYEFDGLPAKPVRDETPEPYAVLSHC